MRREGKENMMGMMSKMMQGDKPGMMTEMMPKCLGVMLQSVQKSDRIAFTIRMVGALVEQSCVGLSDDERKDFVTKLVEKITS